MVAYYLNKIRNGERTIDDVPPRWKEAVEKELEK